MRTFSHQLSQASFYILLALSLKPRHGYEIMQQVRDDTSGRIKLGPGSLYTTISQLATDGLIKEVAGAEPRRRYYMLTNKGWRTLDAELKHLEAALTVGSQRVQRNMPLGNPIWA
jgi:DNA-binding PadR family transcriptional regulator